MFLRVLINKSPNSRTNNIGLGRLGRLGTALLLGSLVDLARDNTSYGNASSIGDERLVEEVHEILGYSTTGGIFSGADPGVISQKTRGKSTIRDDFIEIPLNIGSLVDYFLDTREHALGKFLPANVFAIKLSDFAVFESESSSSTKEQCHGTSEKSRMKHVIKVWNRVWGKMMGCCIQ
ncbi:hypothetical protein HG530_011788 [Fusarium avenaceum]|nr:hypothetical protein HG530_011788 [Fusarium avenaceum]